MKKFGNDESVTSRASMTTNMGQKERASDTTNDMIIVDMVVIPVILPGIEGKEEVMGKNVMTNIGKV